MQAISITDAIRHIDARDYRDGNGTFSIQFMTCHRTKKEGGEILSFNSACKCGLPPSCKGQEMRGIKDMETGKPYAIHNRLIFTINGKEIYWV